MEKYIFFDLDSTLLQMDQNRFLKYYFGAIYEYVATLGYDADTFMKVFNRAAFSIIKNDGSQTNEELFFNAMKPEFPDTETMKKQFDAFYNEVFDRISVIVDKQSTSNAIIQELKKKGYKIVLATNPLFPVICTHKRMKWAGLNPADFEYITTYENCRYCKPNREYFYEIAKRLNISLSGVTMVGNDLSDDFSDLPEEMDKILITDYLINTKNEQFSMKAFKLNDFLTFVKEQL